MQDQPIPSVLKDGLRLDSRGFEEFRSVFLKTGVISQASGSAYAEFGATKVMVGVYGPRQSDRRTGFSEEGRLTCDYKLATFATPQRGMFGQTSSERESSSILQTALESAVRLDTFPKAVVDVYCLVLQAGGSELAVGLTTAALALADAGVELSGLVSACCVSKVEGRLLLDPTTAEEEREENNTLLGMMSGAGEVVQLVSQGHLMNAEFREVLELGMGGCAQLEAAMRQGLLEAAAAQQQRAADAATAAAQQAVAGAKG